MSRNEWRFWSLPPLVSRRISATKTHRTHYQVKYCNFQTKSLGIQQWSKKWNWNAILHEGAQYNRLYKAVPVHSHTAILWGRRTNKRCQMQQPQLRGNMKDRFYKSILINLHVMQPLRQNIMPSKPLRPLFSCKTCKQMQQRSVDHWDWGISSTIDLIVRLYCHTRLATHRPISSVVV